ncbi:MAG TPA: NAD(P)H-dependent oxidoreductase subunit E [Syntrophorhabdales bacterium]|nr:NAD(P)H-dependent oxidoreductase subunit E [Syntrophorhabdales bacterium]
MPVDKKKLDEIILKCGRDRAHLLAIFQDVQKEYRYLPKEAIKYVCMRLGIPQSDGNEVATFYKSLSLKPRGKHTVHVCLGTACHLKGGADVLLSFIRQLDVQTGGTTADGEFTLESVNCLGACALAPLVRVDDKDFGKTTFQEVRNIISDFKDHQ